jgi:TonB-dependent SusC/RagA subfamily outer membrane receptor
VIDKGYSLPVYQAVLINNTFKVPIFAFANSFAYYHKFKRITIMKNNVSKPAKKLAVLLLLPALAGFLAAFAQPEYHYSNLPLQPKTQAPVSQDTVKPVSITLKDAVNKPAEDSEPVAITNDNLEVKITKDDGIKVRTSADKLEGKADSPLFIVDGKEVPSINNLKPEDIKSVSVLKDASATSVYGEKGKNGVIIIEMKKMEEL